MSNSQRTGTKHFKLALVRVAALPVLRLGASSCTYGQLPKGGHALQEELAHHLIEGRDDVHKEDSS